MFTAFCLFALFVTYIVLPLVHPLFIFAIASSEIDKAKDIRAIRKTLESEYQTVKEGEYELY